jgi:hypothetical protein
MRSASRVNHYTKALGYFHQAVAVYSCGDSSSSHSCSMYAKGYSEVMEIKGGLYHKHSQLEQVIACYSMVLSQVQVQPQVQNEQD